MQGITLEILEACSTCRVGSSKRERIREAVTSLANPNYLTERAAAGWRLAALEWERDVPEAIEEPLPWSE